MSDKTGIAWTDATWNPIRGCTRVSEGCRHCYAEALAARYSGPGMWGEGIARQTPSGPRWTGKLALIEKHLDAPLHWKKPRRVFVNSMSDLFHEALTIEQIARVFDVMAAAPQHTFQVLTKRAERMRDILEELPHEISDWPGDSALSLALEYPTRWPLPNVWLGVSAENQAAADERIPALLATPAAVRFVSAEPLIGPIESRVARGLDWIIVGGESGPGHRPMDPAWLTSIVSQCDAAGMPVFVKQDSGPRPGMQGRIPEALWERKEFPG